MGSKGHQALLEDCPGESLTFGMVQSGLSPYESVWVIHMHYIAFNILDLCESRYSQIKPNLKRVYVKFVLKLNQSSLLRKLRKY